MKERKGIILAGGLGTRLYPITKVISKHLLPIFDKPMIYYPLTTLMLAGIREILIITTPKDAPLFKELLSDGSQWGLKLHYAEQTSPEGIAQAMIIAEDFLKGSPSALILGDNIFYGDGLQVLLKEAGQKMNGATIFSYVVSDPKRYGVVEINKDGSVESLVEKPKQPRSSYAITGLYFFDNQVVKLAKNLKLSKRKEYEIVDLLKKYNNKNKLTVEFIGRGGAWLDAGSIKDIYDASSFVSALENRQGLKIACLEEIAFRNGWINKKKIKLAIKFYGKCEYSNYLEKLIK